MKLKTLRSLKKYSWPLAVALLSFAGRTALAVDYPTTILADHPLGYYRLEELSGTTAVDSSASGSFPGVYITANNYPLMGQLGIDSNSISVAAALTNDYVAVGYYPEFNQPGPFSFEVWARPISTPTGGAYRCPIGNSPAYDTATQSGWYVYQTPDVPSELALVTPTGDVFISTTNYALFTWYHIAGTYDGTNMSFYVNGVLIGTQRASAYTANSINNAGVCSFAIGQRGDGYGNFDGNLDEAAFYTNALTLAQIQNHYQVGTNSFRVGPLPPSIITQPASPTVYAGQVATFTVQADGTMPFHYQWYRGASVISGATNSTYSFTTVPADDGASFTVVITNQVGSVTSSPATLTVSTAIQIDAPPTSIIRNVGSSAAFEIVAEGALPLSYQWYSGSTLIPGATSNVLWIYNVQATNDGTTYSVTVVNPYNTNTGNSATLNVQARAVIVPATKYAAVVEADGPTAYWRLDEPNGSTTATDAVGSFDGTYLANSGAFTYQAPTGIPHETDPALGVTGGALVQIPFAIEINPTGAFSVDGWVNAATPPSTNGNDYRTVLSSISNPYGEGPTGWLVYQTAGNNWSWWPYNGFYAGIQLYDYDQIVINQWYYLAMVYDGTTFTFYVNGVAKASATDSGFVPSGNVPPGGSAYYNYNYNVTPGLPYYGSGYFEIGYRYDGGYNPFNGTIDDVAVYNKALTTQQIQSHFLNSTYLTEVTLTNKIILTYSVGTLQTATNVSGPYTTVVGATSPYTNTMTGPARFYRVKVQ